MPERSASLVLALCVALAACSTTAPPAGSPGGAAAAATDGAALGTPSPPPTATLTAEPTHTPAATPAVTATPAATPSAAAPATPTRGPAPAKPTGVTFDDGWTCVYGEDPEAGGCRQPPGAKDDNVPEMIEFTETVTWRAPRSEGLEILVYGVTECPGQPAKPKPGTSGPCLVAGTSLPPSVRTLLATAPASRGQVRWSWRQEMPGLDCGGGPGLLGDPAKKQYSAVVVRAHSASGDSAFAIAFAGGWDNPDWQPGDVC